MNRRQKSHTQTTRSSLLALGLMLALAAPASAQTSVITNVSDIRDMTFEDASQHQPVHIAGLAISESYGGDGIVVFTPDGSIYLHGRREALAPIRRGDRLDVTGHVDPGGFAPMVELEKMSKTGTGHLPDPKPVTYEKLMDGSMDAQWVEIEGVVRSCEPMIGQPNRTHMVLECGGKRLPVQIENKLPSKAYLDDELRLHGICFYRYNSGRQSLGPSLMVPRGAMIATIGAQLSDPYSAPAMSISNLLRFSLNNSFLHRVHVQGTVIHSQSGQGLWLRQGDRGLFVQSDQVQLLRIGDVVDVAGFPTFGTYTPFLEDAVFRKGDHVADPVPVRLTDLENAWRHDADAVQIDARLQEVRNEPDGWTLLLVWNGAPIRATMRRPKEVPQPDDWVPGSVLRASGICQVMTANSGPVTGLWTPQTFQVIIRNPGDISVLSRPPWWTPRKVVYAMALVTFAALGAVGGIALLARRRVRLQDAQRTQAEKEFAAVLAERNRIAREIHDTLAQGLGAVSLQLELAKNKLRTGTEGVTRHVDLAQQSARESLADARNSIWNMRSQALEDGNLAKALEDVLHQQAARTEIKTNFNVSGQATRLPPMVENDFLRIGQEAIINAVKHAQASRVDVKLDFAGPQQVCLEVTDDGHGFNPEKTPQRQGHMGLAAMRQRAAEMHAEFHITSEAGKGTVVRLCTQNGDRKNAKK